MSGSVDQFPVDASGKAVLTDMNGSCFYRGEIHRDSLAPGADAAMFQQTGALS